MQGFQTHTAIQPISNQPLQTQQKPCVTEVCTMLKSIHCYTCLSVILFTGGCIPACTGADPPGPTYPSMHWGRHPPGQTNTNMHWGRHPPGRHIPACTGADIPPRQLLQQTERILLECILVYFC